MILKVLRATLIASPMFDGSDPTSDTSATSIATSLPVSKACQFPAVSAFQEVFTIKSEEIFAKVLNISVNTQSKIFQNQLEYIAFCWSQKTKEK